MMENGKALCEDMDRALGEITRTERPDFDFEQRSGAREVMESLGMNLEGFGIDLEHPALPAGAVLVYGGCSQGETSNLTDRRIPHRSCSLARPCDPEKPRGVRTSAQIGKGSLLDSMDETVTPVGARLVESFLARPERDIAEIEPPLGQVQEFSQNLGGAGQEILKTERTWSDPPLRNWQTP